MQRESRAPAGGKGEVRPRGAMTMAMAAHVDWSTAGERELRVAALRDGRLGDEVRHAKRLRVGPTEKADVIVPVKPQTLFERRSDGWFLRLTPELTGRVASGGPARPVADLRSEGLDRLKLTPDARGRLELGGVSILFQLVPPKPKTKRAPLPQSVRGGFAIDWRFTTSLASVAMLVFGLLVGLEGADWPIEQGNVVPPYLEAVLTWDEPEPPPPPVTETETDTDPSEDTVAEAPTDANPSPTRRDSGPRPAPDDAQPTLEPDAVARLQNEVIGTIRESIGASFADLIDGAAATGELERLLEDVNGVENPQIAGTIVDRRRHDGSGEDRELGELDGRGPPGPTIDDGRELTERRPVGTTEFGPFRPEEPRVFDDDAVLRRVRGMRRRVAQCYEREVTRDPTLEGRVDVELEIHPAGNTSARITNDGVGSRSLAECITNVASSIRFAEGPDGGSVLYSFPFLFAPQR